jgi:hypothetical protein
VTRAVTLPKALAGDHSARLGFDKLRRGSVSGGGDAQQFLISSARGLQPLAEILFPTFGPALRTREQGRIAGRNLSIEWVKPSLDSNQ